MLIDRHRKTGRAPARIALPLLFMVAGASVVAAQERPGRFAMSPVDGGFARLDTETGAMAICKPQSKDAAGQWSCQPMGDTTDELRKLERENRDLKAEIKRMEDLLGLNGDKPKDGQKQAEKPGGLNLPTEQEVDRALSYMERMIKKFQESMKRLEEGARRDPQKGI